MIFLNNSTKINIDEVAHNFNIYVTSVIQNLNMKKANAYTAMSYLHTHFPNGFPEINLHI
jgi:hypothetical protein